MSFYTANSFLALFLLLFSCGWGNDSATENSGNPSSDEDYYNFQSLSLKDHGIHGSIMVPDETASIGATTRPEVIHKESDFIWKILVGPNFELIIEDYGDYKNLVGDMKKRLKEETMFRIEYLTDDPSILVYKRTLIVRGSKKASPKVGVEHSSYHVYAMQTIEGITYELRSRDEGYSKSIIELMAKSIRSFKE